MRISARADYALRALVELAAAGEGPVKGDRIAEAQVVPIKFLENILAELRRHGLVDSRRGAEGGYWLRVPAETVTVADVIRIVDGPLANIRGLRPDEIRYPGHAAPLRDVWLALRTRCAACSSTSRWPTSPAAACRRSRSSRTSRRRRSASPRRPRPARPAAPAGPRRCRPASAPGGRPPRA